jgi:hypothetical protein
MMVAAAGASFSIATNGIRVKFNGTEVCKMPFTKPFDTDLCGQD